ncbi:MAG: c-type cytochrome [Planctomycetaceae bacterium]
MRNALCTPILSTVIVTLLAIQTAVADDLPVDANSQAETVPPLSHAEALKAIRVPEGFHVSLFAGDPDVRNPIDICTDTRGRLWVAENYTYADSKLNYDLSYTDRVIILDDTDGDGVHDVCKIFWDAGKKLTSVAVGHGGVWVTCAPHLLFIPDANGDDIPDGEPVVMLDGFDGDSIRHNIVNGLKWGPDGWLYGRHGIQATSVVGRPGAAESERTLVSCGVWRFHPVTHEFEMVAHGTTNPWGMDWDAHGECWLINTVIGHLWHVVPGAHWRRMYGSDFNPHTYELIDQTADHMHFQAGEVWSDVRKIGISKGTDEAGGGHAHCGLVYCDATWPAEYRGSLLTANLHGRRLNRETLVREGCSYTAKHAPDFLFSDDPYFRVVEIIAARDGGIYLADWSDIGECHENDGVHRTSGRIFKLTWDGMAGWQFDAREAPGVDASRGREKWRTVPQATAAKDVADLPVEQLVALQRHPSEWYARTARQVLHERQVRGDDLATARTALKWMLDANESPVTTLRALWSLDVIDALPASRLQEFIRTSESEYVRAGAVYLLRDLHQPEHLTALNSAASNDPSGLVRLAVASQLRKVPKSSRLQIALALSAQEADAYDRQQPLLTWYGIEPVVVEQPNLAVTIAGSTRMPALARFIARRLTHELATAPHGPELLVALLSAADDKVTPSRKRDLLQGMNEAVRGWRKAKPPAGWSEAATQLAKSDDAEIQRLTRELSVIFGDGRAVEELRKIAQDGGADIPSRRQAVRSLVEARVDGLAPLLVGFLDNRDLAEEAIRGLAAVGGEDAPQQIIARFGRYRFGPREAAITALVSRPESAPLLLDAIQAGKIPRDAVPPFQLRQMLSFGDDGLSTRIRELFPELAQLAESKQSRIAELQQRLTAADLAQADRGAGRVLFQQSCAKCHKLFGEGGTTAPDLTGGQRSNLHYLLENIIDPSATISKNYQMYIVLLDDGRVLNGVIPTRTDRTITLQTPDETLVLDVDSIDELRETSLSLMPEGQLDRLSDEQVRDLIAYLMSPSQVAPPAGAVNGAPATTGEE